jgi:uncharacterized protein YbjT (DUF2867 family)
MFDLSNVIRSKGHEAGLIFVTNIEVVGSRVIAKLLDAGHPRVRVGLPKGSDQADVLSAQGAQVIEFTWEDESTYAAALDGVKTVFCALPHHEGWSRHFPAFFKASRAAHVNHFVKLSFYHALTATRAHIMQGFHVALPENNEFNKVPLIKMHGDCDEMLIRSKTDFTILFASHLMSDPLVYQGKNLKAAHPKFYSASAGKQVNYVSPNDVAEVAVRVLVNPDAHRRVGYTLVGPASIQDAEVADAIGNVLNKPVKYMDLSSEEFKKGQTEEGEPDWMVSDLAALEKMKSSGIESTFVSHDIEALCGHPAESIDEYLQNHDTMSPSEVM